ncbi:MAG TPA: hypothetical protein PKI98_10835, partial [Chitinophagaceae bacterium]|nr:hypothetical protein [Chitinophagaceae bacterium]
MMKNLFTLYFLFFLFSSLSAQEKFNYQANILTKDGLPAANRSFSVNVKISYDSFFVVSNYEEFIQVVSDKFGYITFEIGKNPISGLIREIDWRNDTYIYLDINSVDDLEIFKLTVKHKINFSPKAIYALYANEATKALWSSKTDSSLHAINADTSQYNFVSKWSAKSDSAKHAINADTSQYNFVSKWSAKSDSA